MVYHRSSLRLLLVITFTIQIILSWNGDGNIIFQQYSFLLPMVLLGADAASAEDAISTTMMMKENSSNNNNNDNNNVLDPWLQHQIFQAIDSNHDQDISEEEYTVAIQKLLRTLLFLDGTKGDLNGGDTTTTNNNESSSGQKKTIIYNEAPPLGGMDYNNYVNRKIITTTTTTAAARSNSFPSSTAIFFKGLVSSFSAILATEIGDKTFFIAAVLSMRNDRRAVFGGAIVALVIMTILSTLMGLVLPALLPKKYTHIIGGILFLYFGVKLLLDSRSMQKNKVSEELEEVEEELAEMSKKQSKARRKKRAEQEGTKSGGGSNSSSSSSTKNDNGDSIMDVEDGGGGGALQINRHPSQQMIENGDSDINGAKKRRGGGGSSSAGIHSGSSISSKTLKHTPSSSGLSAAGSYSGGSWESVFVQSLTLTFLAEWGDRSQIATIALAAAKDPIGVAIGGCIGHSVCTGMAVIGGRMLASRISEKSVAFYGGLVFLIFGMHSVFFEE